VSTGAGITLVVAGAILRFAVTATFAHVLNAHVAGVIVMLAGVFALLLSLLVWGPLGRRRSHFGGHDRGSLPDARQRSVYRKQAAAETGSPRWREGGETRFRRAVSVATGRNRHHVRSARHAL
jgi:hypothetical protein